jgi:hypothetical protein
MAGRSTGTARDTRWLAAGTAVLLALVVVALTSRVDERRAAQVALRTRTLELVDRMRLDLASESEAEKSAVLAITDEESVAFADQARVALGAVERERSELDGTLRAATAPAHQRQALDELSQRFAELTQIDDEVLALAVQNSNLKATRLAFGPAAEALAAMDGALARVVGVAATSPADDGRAVALAGDARVRALRVQVLLPRHIAEERDARMDEMEAVLAEEDRGLRADLEQLSAQGGAAEAQDLASASSLWNRFGEIEKQILALSRANTNVRSLNLSLSRKRAAMLACQDSLASLREAIERAPSDGLSRAAPPHPR